MTGCLLCGADLATAEMVAIKARFGRDSRRVICPRCALVQVSPQPDNADLIAFYRGGAYRAEHKDIILNITQGGTTKQVGPQDPGYLSALLLLARNQADRHWAMCSMERGTRVLEIGCGDGRLLTEMVARGCAVEGVEPDVKCAGIAASAGHTIHRGTAEDHLATGPYDVIIMSHVLEHVGDPVEVLRSLRAILAPGGRVSVEVPNLLTPVGPLVANHFQWVHLTDWCKETLGAAFWRAGYRDLRVMERRDAEGRPFTNLCVSGVASGEPGEYEDHGGPAWQWWHGYMTAIEDERAK